jgi:molybdate transport system substrate-binding protein
MVWLALPLLTVHAEAAEIKVLSSTAVKTVLEDLGPRFEKSTANKVVFTFAPAATLKTQIEQGTVFDIAILTASLIDGLADEGKIDAATRTAIAKVGIGVAIHLGAPKPDITTPEAFKLALLNAKSIGFTAAGSTGVYLKSLFDKLGITDELKPKLKPLQRGTGEATADGEVEIGLTQISEILPYANAELVGPFPPEIQTYTDFKAGVSVGSKDADVAKAFIKSLTEPAAIPVIKAKGMSPPG